MSWLSSYSTWEKKIIAVGKSHDGVSHGFYSSLSHNNIICMKKLIPETFFSLASFLIDTSRNSEEEHWAMIVLQLKHIYYMASSLSPDHSLTGHRLSYQKVNTIKGALIFATWQYTLKCEGVSR